jgi:YbbR domain-containing protein
MRRWRSAVLSERMRLLALSLAIAVTMWYYASTTLAPAEQAPLRAVLVRNVDVLVSGLAQGWTATVTPARVDVEIRGPEPLLVLRVADVRAIAEVGALEPGVHQVALRVQIPDGVTMVRVTPPVVQVTLTRP